MNEQQQPSNYSSGYSPLKPIIDRAISQDFNRFLQDMTDELQQIELFLAGQKMVKDGDGNIGLFQECQMRVNHVGRQEIMAQLKTILTKNTWMAQTEVETTEKNFVIISASIRRMLAENHIKYELSLKNARVIADMTENLVLMALYRAETDKPTIYGTMSSTNQPSQPQSGQGWVGQLGNGLFKR
jgi:hypothetical protein